MDNKSNNKLNNGDNKEQDKERDDSKKQIQEIGHIKPREIVEEMKDSYIDYAMSVIVSRALPDVRDGLKPVHRRILFAMMDMGLKHNVRFRKSATVVGECFAKDTLILTKKGLIPIQNIKIGDLAYTQNNLKKVTQLYEMPKKPLLKVISENGISNIVTPSQKFKILTPDLKFQWKEAKNLTTNDYLVSKADYPKINNFTKLKKVEKNEPGYLNENLAYFLGMFIAEGSISNDYSKKKLPRIAISNSNKNVMDRMAYILKQEFGYKATIEEKKVRQGKTKKNKAYQKMYAIRINRKCINEFFVSNFNLEHKWALTKEIPCQIFSSPEKVIFAFISGLIEGDGCVSLKRNVIHYGSISKKLIDQLMILLLSQKIFSARYIDKTAKKHFILGRLIQKRHEFHYLEIHSENAVKLASKINLLSQTKNNRAIKLSNKKFSSYDRKGWNKYDLIPYAGKMLFQELSNNNIGAGWYQDTDGNKFRMGIKYPDGCKIRYSSNLLDKPLRKTQIIDWGIKNKLEKIGSPFFDFLQDIVTNKIYFLKISSIEKITPEKTYDFEVENEHEFVANGIISHNCLGKYHPHGDMAVYDSLVRMAQDFSLRYPLVQGQGNFGSIDADPAAASRYTEARMSKIGEEMLKNIEKETVDFRDNYDATRKEPVVLPSPVPQLLLNGTLGIAVGMATSIPPHNLSEVVDATIFLIDNPKADTRELFKFIKGPDYPGGGMIYNQKDIIEAYSVGKGPIEARGKAEIIEDKKGRDSIIITEIPYQVQKSGLVQQFAKLVQEKKITGVKTVRDESDREGMRVVIEMTKEAFPQKILNRLYKFSDLQKTFHINMLALVDGIQPKVLSLSEVLTYFIEHKKQVVIKRTQFDLKKAQERAHILEGLHKCLSKIDAVIKTIKASKNREDAQKNLMKQFKLTVIQANAILEMKLANLAKLERQKIEDELKEKEKMIKEFKDLLASPKRIKDLMKKELQEMKNVFGDERRTKVFVQKIGEIAEEDLIPQEETVVTLTHGGYIKRVNPDIYKIQKRGGKGIMGMKTLGEDVIEHFISCQTHDSLLFFTDSGRVFKVPAYEIPEATRVAKGRGILNFLEITPQEKILSVFSIGKEDEELGIKYLVMATKNGIIKRTELNDFKNVRRSGLIAITLKKNDLLDCVCKSAGKDEIILITKQGQSIRFKEEEIRPMSRIAAGNMGIRLKKSDELVGMDIIKPKTENYLLVLTENGYGKRTNLKEYRLQGRGGSGIKTANITSKTGGIKATKILTGKEEDLIVISQKGQVIRTSISAIAKLGRPTQGVRIMRMDKGDKVASGACM